MSHDPAARRAVPADSDRITSIIALAFAGDPAWGPAMTRPDGQTGHHAELWRPFVDGALRFDASWLTAGREAAAVWIPPDEASMTSEQEKRLAELAAEHLGPAADSYFELMEQVHSAHPRAEPHYFLTLLATHPDHRGHGLGVGLLADSLTMVDAEHQPAYLESTNPANDRKYADLGFEPFGEIACPGGQVITTMWRPAR
jgi:GNAT superfamily N-acetyltransferase